MKISKSKRQLAQLLIEAGVTQFPEGANWAAQDQNAVVTFFADEPWRCDKCWEASQFEAIHAVRMQSKAISNWHQTVLSRDEFDRIVAETAVPGEPGAEIRWVCGDDIHATPTSHDCMVMLKSKGDLVTCECKECNKFYNREGDSAATAPTIDQLLQDWRNADDYARRKQTEADEAAAMRDERWQAVQDRAGEMGVTVGRCETVAVEPEREWSILDHCIVVDSPDDTEWEGRKCALLDVDYDDDRLPYSVIDATGSSLWVRSIRRP